MVKETLKIEGDVIIPRKLLKKAGISRRVIIIVEKGEIRLKKARKVTNRLIGLGKGIRPEKSSVELIKDLRKEWKLD
ncbi:MAG TPA: hypothetical protein EYP80_00600 [Candidatus Aenigmarchaeota archaeon]|nr:hypothetical protein [Candidatus Aenigmarchaeota archaeon]